MTTPAMPAPMTESSHAGGPGGAGVDEPEADDSAERAAPGEPDGPDAAGRAVVVPAGLLAVGALSNCG